MIGLKSEPWVTFDPFMLFNNKFSKFRILSIEIFFINIECYIGKSIFMRIIIATPF